MTNPTPMPVPVFALFDRIHRNPPRRSIAAAASAKAALILSVVLALSGCTFVKASRPAPPTLEFDHTYKAWATVLARCAGPNGFDYVKAKEYGEPLEQASAELRKVTKAHYELFSHEQQLAFLINAHNMAAVRRVLAAYPVSTIEATDSLGMAQWRSDIELLGGKWSLRGLRGEILSRSNRAPRAIFVLNWGMVGCAPLPPLPATAENLDTLLENQTRRFVRNPDYNAFSRKTHHYVLSPLLHDYRRLIEREYTTLNGFLRHFAGPAELKAMELYKPKLVFDGFSKELNDRPLDENARPKSSDESIPETSEKKE